MKKVIIFGFENVRKIESPEKLLHWAKESNFSTEKSMSELQDIFAHSNTEDLKEFFLSFVGNTDFRLIAFSIQKIMGMETFFDYINYYVRFKANRMIVDETQECHDKVMDAWTETGILQVEAKKQIAEAKKVQEDNVIFQQVIERLKKENYDYYLKNDSLKSELKELYSVLKSIDILKKYKFEVD